MLKALEILRQRKETCIRIYNGDDYSEGLDSYKEIIEQTEEAIKELEELENRSCESCKYVIKDTLGYKYCNCAASPLSSCIFALHPDFCCNKWESK